MLLTFLLVQESKQRSTPCYLRPFGLGCAKPKRQPALLACGVRRRIHCAALPLCSNNCGESDHAACVSCGTHAPPQAVRLGAGRRVCESNLNVALAWLALVAMNFEKRFAFARCAGFDGWAGLSHQGVRVSFVCFVKEKEPKERRPCYLHHFVLCCGERRRTHCANLSRRSNSCSESGGRKEYCWSS